MYIVLHVLMWGVFNKISHHSYDPGCLNTANLIVLGGVIGRNGTPASQAFGAVDSDHRRCFVPSLWVTQATCRPLGML